MMRDILKEAVKLSKNNGYFKTNIKGKELKAKVTEFGNKILSFVEYMENTGNKSIERLHIALLINNDAVKNNLHPTKKPNPRNKFYEYQCLYRFARNLIEAKLNDFILSESGTFTSTTNYLKRHFKENYSEDDLADDGQIKIIWPKLDKERLKILLGKDE